MYFFQVNEQFQSDKTNPLQLIDNLTILYEKIIQKIMIPSQFAAMSRKNLSTFQFERHLRRPELVDHSYEFNECFSRQFGFPVDPEKKSIILKRCLDFLVELASQIRDRLPDNMEIFELMRNFEPKMALSAEEKNIRPLLRRFLNIEADIESAVSEYHLLCKREWSSAASNDALKFWTQVYIESGQEENDPFFNVCKFALSILSLPMSNAAVERVFSLMSIVKSKLRNRLQGKTVNAILTVRYGLIWRGETCKNFVISDDMLWKFNQNIYFDNDEVDTQDNENSLVAFSALQDVDE